MDILKILVLGLLISSCAKLIYITEQANGQIGLFFHSRENRDVLGDKNISIEFKDKIKLIEKYKDYFYTFFNLPPQDIYSKTTILKEKAVTYLVIASKYYEIDAKKECFPFVGCFPYLGFFNKKNAYKYAKKIEKDDYVTWIRPVYAYSTLGYMSDPILSSFFVYNDFQLAEIIFHELFHSIFFIKDEVDFNENLAVFFGRQMTYLYFSKQNEILEKHVQKREQSMLLNQKIASEIKKLKAQLMALDIKDKKKIDTEIFDYFENSFNPGIEKFCKSISILKKNCYPIHSKWNNARMAGFLTYQSDSNILQQVYKKSGLSVMGFYKKITKLYALYKKNDMKISFKSYMIKDKQNETNILN